MISAIVAVDNNYGIGSNNELLVHIPEDLKMFKELTTDNVVIMGRKTYETLPVRPLPNRTNIVITSKINNDYGFCMENGVIYSNMDVIKKFLLDKEKLDYNNLNIFIMGGGSIYKQLLPYCDKLYLTKILHSYENVDTYFPNIDEMPEWTLTSESEEKEYNNIKYKFCIYEAELNE